MIRLTAPAAAVDVDYRTTADAVRAVAACVLFHDFADATPAAEHVARVPAVADYEPGAFFRRELPCLLAVLRTVATPLSLIIVDGFVHLGEAHPGLGAHLHDALDRKIPIIGVAKTSYRGAPAVPVTRGDSKRPLWITSAGIDIATAADAIAHMHGPHRIPTLLTRVDRLCRDTAY